MSISQQTIAARIDRLPVSPWHLKMRVILGVATFFDAFDVLAIAYVVPVLIGEWKIGPPQIGAMLAIGFVGQAIGAFGFGWAAERIGRIPSMRISVALFAIMSLVCATAQSYDQLFWYRFVQGIGLGGEVPIAAAYISEIARADHRGRFFSLYEMIFPIGILAVGFVGGWVVPRFGWQWMFVIGAVPALVAAFMQRICPESPRWLAAVGRGDEADRVLTAIEREVSRDGARPLAPVAVRADITPPRPTRWTELFSDGYRRRTLFVWLMWSCSYLVSFGLVVWLPSLYRTIYHLPIQEALYYSLISSVAGLAGSLACALTIDPLGRRKLFIAAFLITAAALLTLWIIGAQTLWVLVTLASVAYFGINATNNGLYLYTAEIYPTRMRALGASWATFWLRAASIAGPYVVGWILPTYGVRGMVLLFCVVAAVGAVASLLGAVETSGKDLEEISP
jgi:MFS transporter, putative metabolite:H+ symporter